MATLFDKRSRYWLTIVPLEPTPQVPGGYRVSLGGGEGETIFEQQYEIDYETPDGHWYVWRLFRACQNALRLANVKMPINITGRRIKDLNEPATIVVNADWISIVLDSYVLTNNYEKSQSTTELQSNLTIYLLDPPLSASTSLPTYKRFDLLCSPQHVVEFGNSLEVECRQTLLLRRQLGLTAPADAYIDH